MFRVGQKVVCVDAQRQGGDPPYAVKGGIYEITGMDIYPRTGVLGLQFAELEMSGGQFLFAWRFRPLTDRKTSIEIFTRMLKPAGVDA